LHSWRDLDRDAVPSAVKNDAKRLIMSKILGSLTSKLRNMPFVRVQVDVNRAVALALLAQVPGTKLRYFVRSDQYVGVIPRTSFDAMQHAICPASINLCWFQVNLVNDVNVSIVDKVAVRLGAIRPRNGALEHDGMTLVFATRLSNLSSSSTSDHPPISSQLHHDSTIANVRCCRFLIRLIFLL
jgi:hypothetical protein